LRSLTGAQLAGVAVVMMGSFVAALDASIVSTVMPTVVGELGGIDRYALVFSAYLLVSTIATPICGRLADIFGRTPVYVTGMVVFVAGSVGAGLSADMNQLIVSRALQGLGSGALLPVGMTIIGDLFDARGRYGSWDWISIGTMLLGMATRISGDFWPAIMASHYNYGAVLWIGGVLLWAAYVLPKVLIMDRAE